MKIKAEKNEMAIKKSMKQRIGFCKDNRIDKPLAK
jgi:hypothetical protein